MSTRSFKLLVRRLCLQFSAKATFVSQSTIHAAHVVVVKHSLTLTLTHSLKDHPSFLVPPIPPTSHPSLFWARASCPRAKQSQPSNTPTQRAGETVTLLQLESHLYIVLPQIQYSSTTHYPQRGERTADELDKAVKRRAPQVCNVVEDHM